MHEKKTDKESDKCATEAVSKQPRENVPSIRHNSPSDAGEIKPSDEQLLDLVKQHRTPPESYAAARKIYGPGHAVRMKQLAVERGLWKRKREKPAPSSASVTSVSSEYAASDTASASQNATSHDSMTSAFVNVDDHDPSEHLKAFNALFTASKRAG